MTFLPLAGSQEIPRPSLARQQAQQTPLAPSNLKIGQVLLTMDATMRTEYVDNVYLTASDKSGDFILNPEFGLNAAWQVTRLNTLRLRTSVGYSKYLNNPKLDSQDLTVAPNSALTFDVYVGDFRIEFHDQFSIQNETLDQGSLSGVAKLPRFTNTAGVSILWDLNEVVWSLGYDHYNFLTFGSAEGSSGLSESEVKRLDHRTDQVSTSASLKLNSTTTAGLEATASYSSYPNDSTADFTSFSGGPFVQVQLTKYTSAVVGAGYKGYSFEDGPPITVTVDQAGTTAVIPGRKGGTSSGYYASLGLVHRLNRFYSDRLDTGHEDQADALSGRTESNYVRYSASWAFNSHFQLGIGMFFEDVRESTGNTFNGAPPSDYLRVGFQFSTSYKLTERINASFAYQFTRKVADEATQNYTQNRVSVALGYSF
jgi:hypothetical protein